MPSSSKSKHTLKLLLSAALILPTLSHAEIGFRAGYSLLEMVVASKKEKKDQSPVTQNKSSLKTGFANCSHLFPKNKTPQSISKEIPSQHRELCFDYFAVLHSGQSKTPVFVIEKLNNEQLTDAKGEERTNKFFADARLPYSERAQLDDYAGSGYDRGHMAPAGDMPNAQSMAQSFSLANMIPQAPENNRKTWSKIEKDTRKYAKRAKGNVYIFSGPFYEKSHQTIGSGKVWVPTHLYKLVYDEETNKAWAHWIENTNQAKIGKTISYQELVNKTGIKFIPHFNEI